jgi:hypothetical protein
MRTPIKASWKNISLHVVASDQGSLDPFWDRSTLLTILHRENRAGWMIFPQNVATFELS